MFAEWPEGDPRRWTLEAVALSTQREVLQFAATTDAALEAAEDSLLAEFGVTQDSRADLTLQDTMLGRGLPMRDLALLQAELETVRSAPGSRLLAASDPGDALYVSVRGDIGPRIPGTARRLASFAPGVTVGEMAVLLRGTRLADAHAETEVVALRLSAAAFERMIADQPLLAAQVLRNLTLHLADRVRVLKGDLAKWVAHSTVGRSAPPAGVPEVAADDESRD